MSNSRYARILLVESYADILDLFTCVLKSKHIVAQARDAKEGLRVFEWFHPHIIVCDLCLPGMSGKEMIEQVQAIDKQVKIVVITGLSGKYKRGLDKLNIAAYIRKPVEIEYFEQTIANLLSKDFFGNKT